MSTTSAPEETSQLPSPTSGRKRRARSYSSQRYELADFPDIVRDPRTWPEVVRQLKGWLGALGISGTAIVSVWRFVESHWQDIDPRLAVAVALLAGLLALGVIGLLWRLAQSQRVPPSVLRDLNLRPGDPLFGRGDGGSDPGAGELSQLMERVTGGSRVILLSGPAQCGKTSLVQAGLITRLERLRRPPYRVVYADVVADPLKALATALGIPGNRNGIASALKKELGDDGSQLLVILDHFERAYEQAADSNASAHDLKPLFDDTPLSCKFLITIRSETLTAHRELLDLYPDLEINRLTIDHFAAEAATHVLERLGKASHPGFGSSIARQAVAEMAPDAASTVSPRELQWFARAAKNFSVANQNGGGAHAVELVGMQLRSQLGLTDSSTSADLDVVRRTLEAFETRQSVSATDLLEVISEGRDESERARLDRVESAVRDLVASHVLVASDGKYRLLRASWIRYARIALDPSQQASRRAQRSLPRPLEVAEVTLGVGGVAILVMVLGLQWLVPAVLPPEPHVARLNGSQNQSASWGPVAFDFAGRHMVADPGVSVTRSNELYFWDVDSLARTPGTLRKPDSPGQGASFLSRPLFLGYSADNHSIFLVADDSDTATEQYSISSWNLSDMRPNEPLSPSSSTRSARLRPECYRERTAAYGPGAFLVIAHHCGTLASSNAPTQSIRSSLDILLADGSVLPPWDDTRMEEEQCEPKSLALNSNGNALAVAYQCDGYAQVLLVDIELRPGPNPAPFQNPKYFAPIKLAGNVVEVHFDPADRVRLVTVDGSQATVFGPLRATESPQTMSYPVGDAVPYASADGAYVATPRGIDGMDIWERGRFLVGYRVGTLVPHFGIQL